MLPAPSAIGTGLPDFPKQSASPEGREYRRGRQSPISACNKGICSSSEVASQNIWPGATGQPRHSMSATGLSTTIRRHTGRFNAADSEPTRSAACHPETGIHAPRPWKRCEAGRHQRFEPYDDNGPAGGPRSSPAGPPPTMTTSQITHPTPGKNLAPVRCFRTLAAGAARVRARRVACRPTAAARVPGINPSRFPMSPSRPSRRACCRCCSCRRHWTTCRRYWFPTCRNPCCQSLCPCQFHFDYRSRRPSSE